MPESEVQNSKQGWFVKSASGVTFGPVDIAELAQWARQSRIFPEDLVSPDNEKWRAARTLPQLKMDTVIATPDGRIHGPLHAEAAAALASNGKLPEGAKIVSAPEILAPRIQSGPTANDEEVARLREAIERLRRETQDAIAEKDREIETLRENATAAGEAENATEAAKHEAEAAKTEAAEAKAAEQAAVAEAKAAKEAADAARKETAEAKAAEEAAVAEAKAAKEAADAARKETAEATTAEQAAVAEAKAAKDAADAARKEAAEAKAAEEAAVAETEAAKAEAAAAKEEAEKAKAEAAPEPDVEKLREENASLAKTVEDQKAEIAELLDFSNARDRESKATIAELERRIGEMSAPEIPPAESPDGPVGDARLVQTLQDRVTDLTRERCSLAEKLAETEAALAMATRPLEADTALVKQFAEEALDALRGEFEEEKRRNDAERTASVQRQNLLHDRIADLERALRRDPGEKTRGELAEERSEKTIAQLRQEIDSLREQHKADLGRAAENERALEGRLQALQHRETAVREQLRRVEKRTADYDSLTSRLRRREEEIVEAEKQFGEARTQWQVVEQMLRRRIDELEHGAGALFENEPAGDGQGNGGKLVLPGWVRNMK